MTAYEILLIYKDYFSDNSQEVIAEMNELIQKIQDNPNKFANELSDELEEYYSPKNICPLCGEELKVIEEWQESRGEFWGQESKETMIRIGCSSCTYVKN